MAKVSYGAGPKPRRRVDKDYQPTDRVYGGNKGGNRGKSYSTGDKTLNKSNPIDSMSSTKRDNRGRSNKGNVKHTTRSTGARARSRANSRKNRAKRGGN